MDLSKLSTDLPLSGPIDEDSIDEVDKELADEFKIGARSIAALYRLSNTKTALINATGYLRCIDDVVSLIDRRDIKDLSDLRSLLQLKRSELTGKKPKTVSKPANVSKEEIAEGKFVVAAKSPFHFPLSKLPIGVQLQVKHRPQRKSKTKQEEKNKQEDGSSDSEVVEESSEDDVMGGDEPRRKKVRQ